MSDPIAWEELYRTSQHASVWPWSELISLVKKHVKLTKSINVLELGPGMGANIPFFLSHECDYWGLEQSPTAVNRIIERFPELEGKVQPKDFTKELIPEKKFQLIIDRCSLPHNRAIDIISCIKLIKESLDVGGYFIGVDWFSTEFSEFRNGTFIEDSFTKTDFKSGHLSDTGIVHFFDKSHLFELFSDFNFIVLEHKLIDKYVPTAGINFAAWNFVVKKR